MHTLQDLDSGHHGSGFPLPPFRAALLREHLAGQVPTKPCQLGACQPLHDVCHAAARVSSGFCRILHAFLQPAGSLMQQALPGRWHCTLLLPQESRAREVARKSQVPAAEARAALLKEKQQEIGSGIAAAGSGTPAGACWMVVASASWYCVEMRLICGFASQQ